MKKISYVDPIIGSVGDEQATSAHGGGKTHPGACYPGGTVQFSPDTFTGGDNGTGYNYCNNTIEGFSLNHMSGIGWYGDLGNIQVMPVIGETDLRSGSNNEVTFKKGTVGWKSEFSHETEIASPGYYAVRLERYGIFAETTVSAHSGLLRVTYPNKSDKRIIFNFSRRIAGHADFEHIEIKDGNRIEGYIVCTPAGGGFGRGAGNISYNLYFVCELLESAESFRFFSDEEYLADSMKICEGEDIGLSVRLSDDTDNILLRFGISYTDLEGAKNNFLSECENADFDSIKNLTEQTWEKELDCITVDGNNETDKKLFYTCLYHTLLDPRLLSDCDGRFRIGNGEILRAEYNQRTMFSGWDVYRSEFPLLTVIKPNTVNDEVNSLLMLAEAYNSAFPRWELMGNDSRCMVGDPGLLVIADAYLKGIRNFDTRKAYEIAKASCMAAESFNGKDFNGLRPRNKNYTEEGFIEGRLSDTLEFLLADFVMSRFAEAVGDKDASDYFKSRCGRYAENYNEHTGFMGARDEKGTFLPVRDEYDTCGCVESNVFQQSWFVPYDINGLSELFGRERMIQLLERLFDKADLTALWNDNYNHSNEPCHNLTHYFNELGIPKRTQYWTRRVQKEAYRLGAFGFCGNEDVGQLSAWYVLSSLGLAQVCIGKPVFSVNTPLFKTANVKLDRRYHKCGNSEYFKIICDNDPMEFPYIKELYLNGEKLDRLHITYDELTNGGELYFRLRK